MPFVIAIGLSTLAFNPFGSDQAEVFVTPKVVWSSIALLLALGALLAFERRKQGSAEQEPVRWRMSVMALSLGAWLVALLVSTLWAPNPILSLVGYETLVEGSGFYGLLTLLGMVVYRLARYDQRLLPLLLVASMAVGAVVTMMAIPQKYDWTTDYTLASVLMEPDDGPLVTPVGVARGQSPNAVFWNRGHFGFVAGLGAVSSLLFFRRWRRNAGLVVVALVLGLTGALISEARAPQLGTVIAVALAIVWPRPGLERSIARFDRILLVGAVAVSMGIVAAITATGGSTRSNSLTGVALGAARVSEATTLAGRGLLWGIALEAWLERPLLGHGFLTFNTHLGKWRVERAVERGSVDTTGRLIVVSESTVSVMDGFEVVWWEYLRGSKPHNALLELLVGVGLVGVVAIIFVLAQLALRAVHVGEVFSPMILLIFGGTYLLLWYESVQYSPIFWSVVAAVLGDAAGRIEHHATARSTAIGNA